MPSRMLIALGCTALLVVGLLAGCSPDDNPGAPTGSTTPSSSSSTAPGQQFPDIIEVEVSGGGDEFSFAVTVSSPYDSPERYADAFRVRSPDGAVFGMQELTHDHATEQPFTRVLDGVAIPADVTSVVVEGRDLLNGWGGETVTVTLSR